MSVLEQPLKPDTGMEPIPGYVLQERLGIGGFGEVWRAEAPGDLLKAVKFVFGTLDEAAAASELAALEQVKRVQHPLLLSLERIEIVGGQLVIVTELAQASLKERFDQCVAEGLEGVPRDELLRYLGDAADALDCLCEEHSLQHLDVKPANLLLLGNRIKVGDFGLVRDIRSSETSPIGGLTPLYSAPEVFDSHPSRHSDQYSLAMVYQHMLTGISPFSGRSPGELAAQHLYRTPNLNPLHSADQEALARGLSKDPRQRYPSCRAMIDTLLRLQIDSDPKSRRRRAISSSKTPPVTPSPGTDGTQTLPLASTTPVIRSLPPVELPEEPTALRPTIFLGVGGTAGHVLRYLQERIERQFGDIDQLSAVQMLLLDTDAEDLSQFQCNGTTCGLARQNTLAMPLRKSTAYRPQAEQLLQWIHRRWLYNIPRSLKTEGYRPLGRLALIDHVSRVIARLREMIGEATDSDALERCCSISGLPFQSLPPRVFIVASTSGGTGSGMALDLSYILQELLVEAGFRNGLVCGVLTHGTPPDSRGRDLAISNTIAFLRELQHLQAKGGHYPGDAAFHLANHYQRDITFDETYLIQLGDALDTRKIKARCNTIAEYLIQNSLTPAHDFFDRCRNPESTESESATDRSQVLRTFALYAEKEFDGDISREDVDLLCRSLLDKWLTRLTDASEIETFASRYFVDADLRLSKLVERLVTNFARHQDGDMDKSLRHQTRSWLKEETSQLEEVTQANLLTVIERIDASMRRCRTAPRSNTSAPTNADLLSKISAELAQHSVDGISDWLCQLPDEYNLPFDGSEQATQHLAKHLGVLESQANRVRNRLNEQASQAREQILDAVSNAQADEDHFLRQLNNYAGLRVYEAVHQAVCDLAHSIRLQINSIAEQFTNFRNRLRQIEGEFSRPVEQLLTNIHNRNRQRGWLKTAPAQTIEVFDQEIRKRLGPSEPTLCRVLKRITLHAPTTIEVLREVARDILTGQQGAVDSPCEPASDDSFQATIARDCMTNGTPPLLECGGDKRYLLVVPQEARINSVHRSLENTLGTSPTVVRHHGTELLFCCEVDKVPISNIANRLIRYRREYLALASRLHTRTDVRWLGDEHSGNGAD